MTLTVKCLGPKNTQKNTIRALEPRGILVGCFAIIWVSLSQDNIIFKLLPCFNMKTNCAAVIGIFCCKDKTVVIYSHLYNSYTARRRLQIDASRHPSHPPPTPTPTPTTHTLEFRMTFHLSKILMIKMTLDKWMKGYDRKKLCYETKQNNNSSFTSEHFLAPFFCVSSLRHIYQSPQQRLSPVIKVLISKCFSKNQIVHCIPWMMICMFMVLI